MRILYDGMIYSIQEAGGINRYFASLISRLPPEITPILTVNQKHAINYPQHPQLKTWYYQRYGFRPNRLSYWLEPYYFRTMTMFSRPDVIHPMYYTTLTRQRIKKFSAPVVITIHDMIDEIFSKQIHDSFEKIEAKRQAISAAQAIICVSEQTKRDLLERYAYPENKITVIYHGSELDKNLLHGTEPEPIPPYFLYVGSRAIYKNFDSLLSSFAKVISCHPTVKLCVVGPPFTDNEIARITDLKLHDHIIHYGYVDDKHLAQLYHRSMAFVYPSRYEGFGIPLLEAMSCGTAVIAANTSSIPEVVGEASLLFDVNITDDLTEKLLFLINRPQERKRLINMGYQQAKLFSWDKTVAQTIQVYQSVM